MTPLCNAVEDLKQEFQLSNEQTVSLLRQYINNIEHKQSEVSPKSIKRSNKNGTNIQLVQGK